MKKKVAFYTLGCKVNQYETNAIKNQFVEAGYEVVDFTDFSDIYIVNTCTVTGMSDKKSRQILRRAKQINPNSIVCAIGCYVQVAKEEVSKIDDVDIILGTIEKKNILSRVEEKLKEKSSTKIIESENILKLRPYDEFGGIAYSNHIRAEIKIEDGCDRFCSYCIIPYARGPVRSRKVESIVDEVKELAKGGIKEIVITGIHVSSYGKDFENSDFNLDDPEIRINYNFLKLLEELNEINGIERIRLSSLEPRVITSDFVWGLTKITKLCNHFHLSLQSGCDETLKRMNRKYTTEEFYDITELLRNNIPEVALTTDVIVGFPGESETEFKKTVEFLKRVKFSKMHVFKYSKRKGTPAAVMENQIPESKKEERSKTLISMSENNEREFAMQYIGKTIKVLFEDDREGHTTNYIKVKLEKPNKEYTNKIIDVIPVRYENEALICN